MTTTKKSPFKKPAQIAIKSVPTLSTQSASLCAPDSYILSLLNNTLYYLMFKPNVPVIERALVDLMLSGGLRVSEVLQPSQFKINMLGQVFIPGNKGSNNKLVTPMICRQFWLDKAPIAYNPFINYSRFCVHRLFLANELVIINTGNHHNITTHSMRHLQVLLMELMELPKEDLSRLIGHKSYNAINYYLNDKKNKP